MAEEFYVDFISGGSLEGYPGQYGAGRVFFDKDTRAFLRIEPPGGYSPEVHGERPAPPAAPEKPAPVDTQIANGG